MNEDEEFATGNEESDIDNLINVLSDQLDRLTAALHANRCHPDYEYYIAPGSRATETRVIAWELARWERNSEFRTAPGDECWRRRRAP